MADFLKAYEKTNKNEGGNYSYTADPVDPGGETFMGISRRHHPAWAGWPLIDEAKSGKTFPHNLGYYPQLIDLVKLFYKRTFWDPMNLDLIQNETLAGKLYDTAINVSIRMAIKFLQRTLNAANRKGELWSDITIDGDFGPATLAAAAAAEKAGRMNGVLAGIKALQGAYYFSLMEKNPALEKYYLGWLTRAMS